MRIAQVSHLFPPATGGIEHHTYEISRELAALGDEVTVFTTAVEGAPKEESVQGFRVRRFFSINFPMFSSVRLPPALLFALLAGDFDVYCSHGYGSLMPFLTSIAALVRRKPFVFTLHGYPRLRGVSGLFQSFYRIFLASVFLRVAKKVIVVSRASVEDIKREVDGRKIVYIPNGIVAEDFSCDSYRDKDAIAYVGRLDKYKGVDMLIRAYASLGKRHPGLKLRIVGRDEGIRKELEALADGLGVKIEFMDVPYSGIKKVYCSCKAIVLPSRYEGFSLVWLEAISSGRPMFSTPVGDARYLFGQVYGEDAEKFIFKDEKELVERVSYFLGNQEKMEGVIRKAEYICKEEYSWKNIAAITSNVYKEVLGQGQKTRKDLPAR